MPRTAIHHESRKRELVAVAEQVFIRLGYAETTVSDLLAATGMSKGGFYHYFGSKDDVLREAIAVVLDEATAHLDSESEAAVQRALDNALEGRTALVIAHRLSTIRSADEIVVIGEHGILERGTHAQLVKQGGVYAELAAGARLSGEG